MGPSQLVFTNSGGWRKQRTDGPAGSAESDVTVEKKKLYLNKFFACSVKCFVAPTVPVFYGLILQHVG